MSKLEERLSPIGLRGDSSLSLDDVSRSIINDVDLPFDADPAAQEKAILERLAAAETEDELFGELGEAPGWGNYADVPIEVYGFRLMPSNLEGAKVYAVVSGYRLDEGEPVVLSTSAKGILVQLIRGYELGLIPGVFKMAEVGREVKGRNRAQRLYRLGDAEERTNGSGK